MRTAKVVSDASRRYRRELSGSRPPSAGYSTEEFRFLHILEILQGKRWPVAVDVQGGIQHFACIIHGLDVVKDHQGRTIESKVFAVPEVYLENEKDEEGEVRTPTEEPTGSMKMLIVRLLTPWTDGFAAQQRPEERDECGVLEKCPHCDSDNLHTSYWEGTKRFFHLCKGCRARFTTKEET